MEYHLKGNYNESIKLYEKELKNINNNNNNNNGIIQLHKKVNLYCNLASAEFSLGLFRKALKSCEQALLIDDTCLRAYEIQAKTYIAMKKIDKGKECAMIGLTKIDNYSDFYIANQIVEILITCDESTTTSITSSPSMTLPTPSLLNGNISSSSTPSIPTIPQKQLQQTQSQQQPPQPPPQQQQQHKKPFQNQQSMASLTELKENAKNWDDSSDILSDVKYSKEDFQIRELLTLEDLTQLRDHFISKGTQDEATSLGKVHYSYISSARQNLSFATGIDVIDDLIAFGYLIVNSNKLKEAQDLFQVLLAYKPDLYAGHLAIGSILALAGKYEDSIKSFSIAISINPYEPDGWKRRGQTRAASGNLLVSLEDYNHALTLGNDPDTYYQRALLYQQMKNFRLAILDILKHNELTNYRNALIYNNLGLCQSQTGDVEAALPSFRKAIECDENFMEGYSNLAQMSKEIGRWKDAEFIFDNLSKKFRIFTSISTEKSMAYVYYFRASLHYSLGKSLLALGYCKRSIEMMHNEFGELKPIYIEKDLINNLIILSGCQIALGLYKDAIESYNQILLKDPTHICRIQKRILLYYYSRLNINPAYFNIDRDINPLWKEIWSKSLVASLQLIPDSPIEKTIEDLYTCENINDINLTPDQKKIKEIACNIGPWIHLNSRGFLPNLKFKRAFGYAALQMAQSLLRNVEHIHEMGTPIIVSNCGSSQKRLYPDDDGEHLYGYRDFFDIAVKWRQLAEPNDSVWWVDGFTRESFLEGFGLQTPMISGQLKCVRYYSYYEMGFQVLKKQAALKYYLATSQCIIPTVEKHKQILLSKNLDDIYNIIGKDFYVICPCESLSNTPSTILESTRLTVIKRQPDGFEFSIRSPGLPIRWDAMEKEMNICFENIIQALIHQKYSSQVNDTELFTTSLSSALQSSSSISTSISNLNSQSPPIPPPLPNTTNTNTNTTINTNINTNTSPNKISSTTKLSSNTISTNPLVHALKLFYFWTNFSPLSRGSAYCGYCGLMAVVLAFGYRISSPIPENKQFDWESIFTPNSNTFVSNILPLLTTEVFEWEEEFKGININDSFLTLKDMIKLLFDGIDDEEN